MNLAVYGNGLANDVINYVDCVMKRDVYPQIHVLKISVVYYILF